MSNSMALLPDTYSPARIEIRWLVLPRYRAVRKHHSHLRAVQDALEAQADALVSPLRLEAARTKARLEILRIFSSLLQSGLDVEEASAATRRLIEHDLPLGRPKENLDELNAPTETSPSVAAKRAFRFLVSRIHPDVSAAALFVFAAQGVDLDELLIDAIEAQQAGDADTLIALSLLVEHCAADLAPESGATGLGLSRQEELTYLHRALQALSAETAALANSELMQARIPASKPPRLEPVFLERLVAQHRTSLAFLRSEADRAEQKLEGQNPAASAIARQLEKEFGL